MAKNKIKIVPNYKKKADPQMEVYWQAFAAGRDHERKIAVQYFVDKLHELRQVKGIGDEMMGRIIDFINEGWGKNE